MSVHRSSFSAKAPYIRKLNERTIIEIYPVKFLRNISLGWWTVNNGTIMYNEKNKNLLAIGYTFDNYGKIVP